MEKDKDGYARAVRLEKAKPTLQEEKQFKSIVLMMVIFLFAIFLMGIVGSAIIFWRIFG
jgi:hypothetical protein